MPPRLLALAPLLGLLACGPAASEPAASGSAGQPGGGNAGSGNAGSGNAGSGNAGAPGSGNAGGNAGSGQAGGGQAGSAAAAGAGGSCEGATVTKAAGLVTSADGSPLDGMIAQLCLDFVDGGLCFSGKPVPADGHYTLSASPGVPCVTRSSVRVASLTPRRSSSYCVASGEGDSLAVGSTVVYAVPLASELPPEGVTTEERAVRFEDGLEVRVVPENFLPEIGTYDQLGARWVDPAGSGLCFLDGAPAMDGLYAFWPEGDIQGGFPFRVPNRLHLPPGTALTFFALGGLICSLTDDTKIHEGKLESFGRGHVDPAGEFLVPDAEVLLPCLTWLGYAADKG